MRFEIADTPDFGLLCATFEAPGETLVAESGAMVSHSAGVQMTTSMRGGLMAAAKRKLLGGESLFQNTFTASAAGEHVLLAPAPEGDLRSRELAAGEAFFLQSGAYLAHHGDLKIDTKWGGVRSFFGGVGFFMLRLEGPGQVFFNSYGAIHEVEVGPGGYVCDTGHIVGFTGGLDFRVRPFGGMKGLFFSGEGLVCEFSGHGRLYIQTRAAPSLAAFLEPFRRVQRRSQGGD